MQIGLVILSTAILAVSATSVHILNSANGILQIIEVGENTLEAIFYNEETGIRIRADSTSLTLISMANDEVLLSASRPHNSSFLTSVLGSTFLEYETTTEEGEQRTVVFAVPESLVDQTKEAVEAMEEESVISQLNGDETETRTIQDTAFERLFEQPELELLDGAARALGAAGIRGHEHQGALNFYGTAMAVVQEQQRKNTDGKRSIDVVTQQSEDDGHSHFKRSCILQHCANVQRHCRKCPVGPNCLGLCGRGCVCWPFVCDNCCFNQGCFEHDLCCKRNGFLSLSCLFPIGFRCRGYK